MPPVTFSATYLLLHQEGCLISSSLTTGLTQLQVSNVHNKGAFYSSLFNISIGLERLLKACVIMDHMLNNQLAVPTKNALKTYGHSIHDLYETCGRIATTRNVQLDARAQLDGPTQEILQLMDDFAKTTRYYNLDSLSQAQPGIDPLVHWDRLITAVLNTDVSPRRINAAIAEATYVSERIQGITDTIMQGMDQSALTTHQALSIPSLQRLAIPYIILRIIKMLTQLRTLISELSHQAYFLPGSSPPFPQMQEFLEWVWDDKAYVLRKRRWP